LGFCLVLVHCDARGSEVMVGNWSHVFRFEQGSAASLGSVFVHTVENSEDGTFSIDDVKAQMRGTDIHEPVTQLVVVEQTHNMSGHKIMNINRTFFEFFV
jgi:threonine aldolase